MAKSDNEDEFRQPSGESDVNSLPGSDDGAGAQYYVASYDLDKDPSFAAMLNKPRGSATADGSPQVHIALAMSVPEPTYFVTGPASARRCFSDSWNCVRLVAKMEYKVLPRSKYGLARQDPSQPFL